VEELIYQFLLHAGYPKASLISDLSTLPQVGSTQGNGTIPTFAVQDPDTAECLAVIKVIAADDEIGFDKQVLTTGKFANQIGGDAVQGFVIRVDVDAIEGSQVQFFRVWPTDQQSELTAKTFPDIDTLKVARQMISTEPRRAAAEPVTSRRQTLSQGRSSRAKRRSGVFPRIGFYLPAAALTALLVIDWVFELATGSNLVNGAQRSLAVGIALLMTIPSAIRYLGEVSNQTN